ncbi:MAG TPA: 30S ribosomal protein S4 [Candidatus Dojkabacteria bacterium]|jgi:small subunit ribosomal protein S4
MARYTGPKWRINRREGTTVLGNNENWKKRPTPPGQHGLSRSRPSNYAEQFREKQKIKRTYGMLEKQFRKFYALALKSTGNTGTRFLQLLEMRLDNVVYRMKFASTREQARQMVAHGHIRVNGKKLDIPSYIVNVGDKISLSSKFAANEMVKNAQLERKVEKVPQWLVSAKADGEVKAEPLRNDIDSSMREQLVIELYSRYNIK